MQGRPLCCSQNQGQPIRAVLAAAAIDHHWLNPGERYGLALCRTECLLNLRSRRDPALALYPLRKPFGHRSLGRLGFKASDRHRLGGLSARAAELDVTRCIGSDHKWPHYYRRPELADAIVPYVYFADAVQVQNVSSVEPRAMRRLP